MEYIYKIAENVISVEVPEELDAWEKIERRYRPFAVDTAEQPVLSVAIKVQPLTGCDGDYMYEPKYNDIGFIMARAARLADESVAMEFMHIEENKPRLRMVMPMDMNKAEIVFDAVGDECDSYFLTHALMIAYMLGTLRAGTLLIHSSSVLFDGNAYLFQGKSGTGKSTHAALWTRNIPGAELLNDDNPVIRFSTDGIAMAYGSPWSGKIHCYRNLSAPIGAFVRIVRDSENVLHRLSPLKSYASLTTSVFFLPFLSDELRETRHRTIERMALGVPCYEMHCLPDADAAFTCMRGLSDNHK